MTLAWYVCHMSEYSSLTNCNIRSVPQLASQNRETTMTYENAESDDTLAFSKMRFHSSQLGVLFPCDEQHSSSIWPSSGSKELSQSIGLSFDKSFSVASSTTVSSSMASFKVYEYDQSNCTTTNFLYCQTHFTCEFPFSWKSSKVRFPRIKVTCPVFCRPFVTSGTCTPIATD